MNNSLRDDLKTLLLPFGYLTEDKLDEILALIASKMPEKNKETRGNTQNPNNPMYSTKFANGWNACLEEVKSILKGETK